MGYLDTELEILRNVMKRFLTMDDKQAYEKNVQILIDEFVGDKIITYKLYDLMNKLESCDVPVYPDNLSKEILGVNIFDMDLQDVYEICYADILTKFYAYAKRFENINPDTDLNLKELIFNVKQAFTFNVAEDFRDATQRNKLYKSKEFQDFLDNRCFELLEINIAIDNLKQSLYEEVEDDI